MNELMPVIIDTDPGNGVAGADVDDALAIALALRSPEIEVLAITVVAGNVPVDLGVRGALEVVELAGATHVPVYRGAERPLVEDPRAWRTLLDTRRDDPLAQARWRHVVRPEISCSVAPGSAAQVLVDLVNARPGEMTVVAIGPLTNIATAMLIDPQWAEKVGRIIWMGGAFELPDVLQELNAAYDPESTHMVMTSSAPMLIIPLDVSLRTTLRLDGVERLESSGSSLAEYLGSMVRPWVEWLAERFDRDGSPLHDPLAVAALLDPSVIGTRMRSAGIELHGRLTRGRTVAWDATNEELLQTIVRLPPARPVEIAESVDNDAFTPMLVDRLIEKRFLA